MPFAALGNLFVALTLAGAPGTFQAVENGAFELPRTAGPIPWWRASDGVVLRAADGAGTWCEVPAGGWIEQPIAAAVGSLEGWILTARVAGGAGRALLVDAAGREHAVRFEPTGSPVSVELSDELVAAGLVPRLTLRLEPAGDAPARWTDVGLLRPLPSAAPGDLRAEVVRRLDEVFTVWFERGLDRDGPEPTGFACHGVDVVTGERVATISGSWLDLWDHVLFALEVEPNERWAAALDDFLGDFLGRGIHPATGMPRRWDCLRDEPLDHEIVEITAHLRFLLDVNEHGPARWRAPALAAAVRIGEAVLAHGVLPDGSIAPRYVPATAAPNTDAPPIRRLNVPAQLARLGGVTGDPRFRAAARRATLEFELLHHWGGAWDRIDPDFDDRFGTLGAALVVMLESAPEDGVFERPLASGWAHFAPLWRDAVRSGGSVAADQVRCWKLLTRYAALRPELDVAQRVHEAARAHFKGEQYGNGAWIDVTFEGFDPKTGLEVGDLPGTPANLLWGLAVAHDPAGPHEAWTRAAFTTVLRSTVEQYARPFGYLGTATERAGAADAPGADLRLGYGLVTMLRRLSGR